VQDICAASAIGRLVLSYTAAPNAQLDASSLTFARKFAYDIMHICAFKMAAVFMITTSTLSIYTRVTTRPVRSGSARQGSSVPAPAV
jgi:hypothetical protein